MELSSGKGKHGRSTAEETVTEMDKFRQSFALEQDGGYLKPGGDEQMRVRENTVLAFVMGASLQDCKTVSELPRAYMATVDVSSTHDTHHDPHVSGVAKYELTIRGGAWYVFKPEDSKHATKQDYRSAGRKRYTDQGRVLQMGLFLAAPGPAAGGTDRAWHTKFY